MAKPAVDGLQRDLATRGLSLVRLSTGDQIGAQLAQSYGVRGVPSLMVFDRSGEIGLRQVGHVDPDGVLAYTDSH